MGYNARSDEIRDNISDVGWVGSKTWCAGNCAPLQRYAFRQRLCLVLA